MSRLHNLGALIGNALAKDANQSGALALPGREEAPAPAPAADHRVGCPVRMWQDILGGQENRYDI